MIATCARQPISTALTACALASSGCDSLFGLVPLGTPIDAPGDAEIDAPPVEVNGTLMRLRLTNDSDLMPHLGSQPGPDVPRVRVGDAPIEITRSPTTGAFRYTSETGAVSRLVVGNVEFQSRSSVLALDEVVLGHPGGVPIVPGDHFDIQIITPAIAVGLVNVSTTGTWSSTVPTDLGSNKFRVDWATAGWSPGQSPTRIDAAQRDQIYIHAIEVVGTPTPFLRISHQLSLSTTLGSSTSTTVGLHPPPFDSCVQLTAARGDEYTAFIASVPFPITDTMGSWSVMAVPRPDLGMTWTLGLAASRGIPTSPATFISRCRWQATSSYWPWTPRPPASFTGPP